MKDLSQLILDVKNAETHLDSCLEALDKELKPYMGSMDIDAFKIYRGMCHEGAKAFIQLAFDVVLKGQCRVEETKFLIIGPARRTQEHYDAFMKSIPPPVIFVDEAAEIDPEVYKAATHGDFTIQELDDTNKNEKGK